jgi:hypothetical protein
MALIRARDISDPVEYTAPLPARSDPRGDAQKVLSAVGNVLSAASADDAPSADVLPAPENAGKVAWVPAEAKAASGESRDSAPAAPSASRGHEVTNAVIVVSPHAGLGTRHFDYRDRVTTGQRAYNLPSAPIVGVSSEVYPFVLTDTGMLSMLGFSAEYATSAFLQSGTSDGQKVDTSWMSLDLGLRGRLSLLSSRLVVSPKLGYGLTSFSLGDGTELVTQSGQLPSVSYNFVRTGVDVRASVWKIAFLGGIDYLVVTKAGDVAARYPHASVGGIDANLGLGFAFMNHFEARTGVRYQRFFYSMHPDRADANIAGGALDELARWDSSIAFYH